MLFYRSQVGAAILFWSWQRSVYVVAMFAYYHSHCGRRHFVLVMATQCLCCCYVRVLSLTCGRRHFVLLVATQCLCCCYVRVLSLTCGRCHIEFNVATQCLCCCYVRVLSLTLWAPPFCFGHGNAVFMLLLCCFIAHMWAPPFCFGHGNAVFMLLLCSLIITHTVGAAILFWSWQRSVYVVAMFAYYHSHVGAAILFWS